MNNDIDIQEENKEIKQEQGFNNKESTKIWLKTVVLVLGLFVVVEGGFLSWQNYRFDKIEKDYLQKSNLLEKRLLESDNHDQEVDNNCQEDIDKLKHSIGMLFLKFRTIDVSNDDRYWTEYKNDRLGFSISLPREGYTEKKLWGFEKGDTIIINSSEDDPNGGWKFHFKQVKNDQELDSFIKEVYGEKCEFGGKILIGKDIYEVHIKNAGDPEACFVNYVTRIRFNPLKEKAVAWILGQDSIYSFKDEGTGLNKVDTDDRMADSIELFL